MWIIGILMAIIMFWSVPVFAEPGFDEKYQRNSVNQTIISRLECIAKQALLPI